MKSPKYYPLQSKRMKEAMGDKGLRAVDLSKQTGILKSSLSQYINGTHAITNIKADILGKVLDVNPLWLMGFDVPKHENEPDQYYLDHETAEKAQIIFKEKELQALLDAAWDSRPEDISMAAELLRRLKQTNPDG